MVLSQPDRPAGRGRKLKESAVKALAKQHNIPVYTPLSLRVEKGGEETAEVLTKMQEAKADVLVVAAYGLIVPQFVLDIPSGVLPQKFPTLKAVNIHGSLLPEWRGAAPIARAIERGDKETGITLMQMDAGLDTGDMLLKTEVKIEKDETGGSLHDKLAEAGAKLCVETLKALEEKTVIPVKQGETTTAYAKMLDKKLGNIDWNIDAVSIERLIRGLNPWPSAYTMWNGKVMKIWAAEVVEESTKEEPGTIVKVEKEAFTVQTGDLQLKILELQIPGKKRMDAGAFLRGYQIKEMTKLGD